MEKWKLLSKNGIDFNVSNQGKVQVVNFDKKRPIRTVKSLDEFSHNGGHPNDRYLSTHGQFVHRLVAEAWIGPIPEGYEVNHLDADKWNNEVSNLEIVTRSENMQHAFDNGLNKRRKPVFYLLDDEDEVVAEFYDERAAACFLFCAGSEVKSILSHFPKSKYQLVRAI